MPLAAGKAAFKATMKAHMLLMSENVDKDQTPEQAIDQYLEVLATALDLYIKNATVSPTTLGVPSMTANAFPVLGLGELL